jgi:hypothetical protein
MPVRRWSLQFSLNLLLMEEGAEGIDQGDVSVGMCAVGLKDCHTIWWQIPAQEAQHTE